MSAIQTSYQVRFEWGEEGLQCLAPESDIVVIVDVLSFTTAVSVAVERGAIVFPYRWADNSAISFAQAKNATLLGKRDENGLSLSPASLKCVQSGQRLVMPSPNGSTLSFIAASYGNRVISGSLHNAMAVADAVRSQGQSVAVIAAGERWQSGNLRPALEDLIGAGAILSYLDESRLSPEAKSAKAVFQSVKLNLRSTLMECVSGRELVDRGYAEDVEIASCLNESSGVPLLMAGAFRNQPEFSASHGFSHVTINVSNLETSLGFYVGTLEMKLVHRGRRDAYIEWGTAWICLQERPELAPQQPQLGVDHVALYISPDKFEAAVTKLRNANVLIARGPVERGGGWTVSFLDPDSTQLELYTGTLAERMEVWK